MAFALVMMKVSVAPSPCSSTISGNIVKMVVIKTDPGYGPDPEKTGTGTVMSVVCVRSTNPKVDQPILGDIEEMLDWLVAVKPEGILRSPDVAPCIPGP